MFYLVTAHPFELINPPMWPVRDKCAISKGTHRKGGLLAKGGLMPINAVPDADVGAAPLESA
jgi:hypothetical protein